jgi:hypothetical protein
VASEKIKGGKGEYKKVRIGKKMKEKEGYEGLIPDPRFETDLI